MVMPERQICPECFHPFIGSDARGRPCPVCEIERRDRKQVLVLSDNELWNDFCRRQFPTIAGHLADFHFWYGDFDVNDDDWLEQYGYKADLIWGAHARQIFPKRLVERVTCVNIHPGFNPHNRGWRPYVFSIINGLPAGATLHVMDENIDSGPIIDRIHVPVSEIDTAYTLWKRCYAAERELVIRWLPDVIRGTYHTTPPEHLGNYNSRKDYQELEQLHPDLLLKPEEFIRRLRALTWKDTGNGTIQTTAGCYKVGAVVDFIPAEDADDHRTVSEVTDA